NDMKMCLKHNSNIIQYFAQQSNIVSQKYSEELGNFYADLCSKFDVDFDLNQYKANANLIDDVEIDTKYHHVV
ncbi:MAG: hypothetical protein MHPSP_000563, partial [Paramarteilia canceri]